MVSFKEADAKGFKRKKNDCWHQAFFLADEKPISQVVTNKNEIWLKHRSNKIKSDNDLQWFSLTTDDNNLQSCGLDRDFRDVFWGGASEKKNVEERW